jgi:lipid-A-disaccharide synthase
LITTEHFGLVNLIAGEEVATELMQDDLNGESLANELLLLLEPERNREARERLSEVADQLGEGGASERAAQRILEFLESHEAGHSAVRQQP